MVDFSCVLSGEKGTSLSLLSHNSAILSHPVHITFEISKSRGSTSIIITLVHFLWVLVWLFVNVSFLSIQLLLTISNNVDGLCYLPNGWISPNCINSMCWLLKVVSHKLYTDNCIAASREVPRFQVSRVKPYYSICKYEWHHDKVEWYSG